MRDSFHKFMSAVDIDCFRSLRDSYVGENLSYSELLQLFIINHKENMTVSELAKRLNLSRPATTQKVNELEKHGLVVKTTSKKDKRMIFLSLSDKVHMNTSPSKIEKIMDQVDEHFSEEKKAAFEEILEFMADYLLEEA